MIEINLDLLQGFEEQYMNIFYTNYNSIISLFAHQVNPALIRAELRSAYVHLTASEEVTGPRTCSLMEKLLVIYEKHFADMTGSTA